MVPVAEIEPVRVVSINPSTATATPVTVNELYTPEELIIVANTIEGEAGGLSEEEMKLVAWCICNRVDSGKWGSTISEVVTPQQFHGYNPDRVLGSKIASWPGQPSTEEVSAYLIQVAREVLDDWSLGRSAAVLEPYASTSTYLYFYGDGEHNWFREVY